MNKSLVVQFEYPSSANNKMQLRYVRADVISDDYVTGYEIDNPGSKLEGTYKRYSRTRMARYDPKVIKYE